MAALLCKVLWDSRFFQLTLSFVFMDKVMSRRTKENMEKKG